jgi:virginiamycin B lyase
VVSGAAGIPDPSGVAGAGSSSAGASGVGGALTGSAGASGAGGAAICAVACTSDEYCSAGVCKSRLTEFSTSSAGYLPNYITAGSDGNLWFTAGDIGRITPTGALTFFPPVTPGTVPAGIYIEGVDVGITKGPDGNVWYPVVALDGNAYLTSMDPTGVTTSYALPGDVYAAFGEIATGPDGNLWLAVTSLDIQDDSTLFVGTPTGTATTITLPTAAADPFGIVAGPDGNLWVTETNQSQIARVTPGGTVTELPIPGATTSHPATPTGIAAGQDGNVWFTENGVQAIGRVTPAGSITSYRTTGPTQDLCAGPDGNIWFTGYISAGSQPLYYLGRLTLDGTISEYLVPGLALSITAGPDGNLWFTEPSAGKIGRFVPPPR